MFSTPELLPLTTDRGDSPPGGQAAKAFAIAWAIIAFTTIAAGQVPASRCLPEPGEPQGVRLLSKQKEIDRRVASVGNYAEWFTVLEQGVREAFKIVEREKAKKMYERLDAIYSGLAPFLSEDKRGVKLYIFEDRGFIPPTFEDSASSVPKTMDGFRIGDVIYIHLRWLKARDDELVSILAHELSHHERDFLRLHLIQSDAMLNFDERQMLSIQLELQADEAAIKLLGQSGREPRIFQKTVEKMNHPIAHSPELACLRLEAIEKVLKELSVGL